MKKLSSKDLKKSHNYCISSLRLLLSKFDLSSRDVINFAKRKDFLLILVQRNIGSPLEIFAVEEDQEKKYNHYKIETQEKTIKFEDFQSYVSENHQESKKIIFSFTRIFYDEYQPFIYYKTLEQHEELDMFQDLFRSLSRLSVETDLSELRSLITMGLDNPMVVQVDYSKLNGEFYKNTNKYLVEEEKIAAYKFNHLKKSKEQFARYPG